VAQQFLYYWEHRDAMNFDPPSEELDFDPAKVDHPKEVAAAFVAESSIVRTIVLGSGGPENAEITEQGLRFVRHLLSTSRSMRFGFMPNFKNMDSIRELAREFIRKCGGAASALQTMHAVTATVCD
jgi:hypothetical protein